MNSKTFFLFARTGVVTLIVCGLLASLRFGLTEIFVGGFGDGTEGPLLDLIDGRFVMLTAGCALLSVVFVEAFSRPLVTRLFFRSKSPAKANPAVGGLAPKFGV